MNYRILLLLSSFLIFLTACPNKDKDPEPEPEPVKDPDTPTGPCGKTEFHVIDQSLMDQFLFKQGSYWIYTDSVTGAIDSVHCYGPLTKKGGYTVDLVHIGTCTYNYTYAHDSINQPDNPFPSHYNYYIWDKYVYVCQPYGFASSPLIYNYNNTLTGFQSKAQFYPTITIHSNSYTDVYKFLFSNGAWKYKRGYYYMKPGVGIVKIELITNIITGERSVYELVRYKIVK